MKEVLEPELCGDSCLTDTMTISRGMVTTFPGMEWVEQVTIDHLYYLLMFSLLIPPLVDEPYQPNGKGSTKVLYKYEPPTAEHRVEQMENK